MELIAQMAQTQKMQEIKFEELKTSVGRLQEELENTKEGKLKAECLWKESRDEFRDIEERYNRLLEESKSAKDMYAREMSMAKKQWNTMELELKTTYEDIIGEMRSLEDKNKHLEDELAVTNGKFQTASREVSQLSDERDRWKSLAQDKTEEHSRLEVEHEKTVNDLHNTKMHLLKERNVNDRVLDEVRRLKKELEVRYAQMEEMKNEKDELKARIGELVQIASHNGMLEIECRELKSSMNLIMKGNGAIEEKISKLLHQLTGEMVTTSVQTDMTNSDLDKYDNLDRQATLLVMGLKEELLNLKQQYLETRQENDTLKGFVQEVKREREMKEEGERVGRLEEAVRSLSEMVRQELYFEPTKETKESSSILQALQDVKKDLNTLKNRRTEKPTAQHRSADDNPVVLPMFQSQSFDPATRPVKLVTFRNYRQ